MVGQLANETIMFLLGFAYERSTRFWHEIWSTTCAEHPLIHTYIAFLSGRVYCSFEMPHVIYERNYTVPV